ncbi:MAG: PAS domain S-box protein [Smithella sp.]
MKKNEKTGKAKSSNTAQKRKRADEALQESERKYKFLTETMIDIVWLTDMELRTSYVTPSIEKVLGFSQEERMRQTLNEQLTPHSSSLVMEALTRELALEEQGSADPNRTLTIALEFYHKDGSTRWLETIVSGIRDDHGVLTGIYGVSRDITKRKQAEEALRASELIYQTIFETTGTTMLIVEEDMTISLANDGFESLTGYTRKEVEGKRKWTDFIEKDDLKKMITYHQLRRTDPKLPAQSYEFRLVHRDGYRKNITLTVNIIPGTKKSIASLMDITQHKKAEELLKQSEAKYRLLADHVKDLVWLMDLNLQVTHISPSVKKLLGYTLEELIQLPLDKLITVTSLQVATEFYSVEMPKALKAPAIYSLRRLLELECYCKDGTVLWIECVFSFIRDKNGKPLSIMGEGRDITERKQMEYDLRASEINFRHSFDDSPLGVRIATIEGETIYANKAILDIYGYDSIEELKKISLKERYTPESYAAFQLRKEKRLRGEIGPSEYEISIVRKNGEIRHLNVFRKEIFWNGKKQSQVIYQDITERKQAEEKLKETLDTLRRSINITIQVLGTASEARDPYTAGHQKRVADLARAIATEMGLSYHTIEGIRMAGAIHDIGKISVPSEILCKPANLTNLEFSLIKNHSQYSYEIIKDVESPWPLADIVHQHHERMNGSGYPQGLEGQNILIEARILAVADVVEAMMSYRPYRPALGLEIALAEIEINAGTLYDRDASDACLKLFREKGYQLTQDGKTDLAEKNVSNKRQSKVELANEEIRIRGVDSILD